MHVCVCVHACVHACMGSCMVMCMFACLSCSRCSVPQQVKDTAVSGLYDAIVVHADHSAVPFFKKYGFSDDLILNSKWAYVFQSRSITLHKGRSTFSPLETISTLFTTVQPQASNLGSLRARPVGLDF